MSLWRRGLIGFAATALAVGCTGHGSSREPRPAAPVHFSSGSHLGLSFDHPRAWDEAKYDMQSSFSFLIVYLSNVKLHDPCTRTFSSDGESITCGDPVKRLTPGGVLVSWSNVGFPHTGAEIPHPNTTIGGQAAVVTTVKPGSCSRIGAQATITADIARPGGNHYEMVACLRGPGVAANETLVRRMLESTVVTE